ncbi:MAG: acyl-CoA thioesterase [Thermoplasmata archaeon]
MGISSGATVAQSRASVVRLMVPTDANFMGNVFGGAILAEVDRVAYITAMRHSKSQCVTASFDRADFIAPVHVGEVVDFDAEITFVGRTSMEVWVRVRAEAGSGGPSRAVLEALITMVAVDRTGSPVPVPPLVLESDLERRRFEEGRARMEARRKTRQKVAP